ncbi:hypothetical protein PCANC_27617 [Puccinia coronata f. sp. avenae]|uniref:Uncharacterized protein n=1 Tax=Puccinia coronata f. sp. avenae TaxID=200324 RepID=A0A2N5TTZ8_9BASI|nr:hypothetical protein PCANC_27617 [Puccinia coronata f. sp. avenae]
MTSRSRSSKGEYAPLNNPGRTVIKRSTPPLDDRTAPVIERRRPPLDCRLYRSSRGGVLLLITRLSRSSRGVRAPPNNPDKPVFKRSTFLLGWYQLGEHSDLSQLAARPVSVGSQACLIQQPGLSQSAAERRTQETPETTEVVACAP